MTKDNPDWLKTKRYLNLDLPIEGKQKAKVVSYVKDKDAVAKHAFLPLIRRTIISYPFREKGEKKIRKPKKRRLTYASHMDSAIFAYYAYNLQKKYEVYLKENELGDVVTAYRKVQSDTHPGNKSNIDFANDVFQYIKQHLAADTPLSVVTFDIKSFFDTLDHKILKRNWKKILQVDELSEDEYNVYKHVVNYAYVDEQAIFNRFKDRVLCRKREGKIVTQKVKNKSYLRNHNALAYCLKKNIKEIRDAELIYSRKRKRDEETIKGIPQGLPISSVLANIYMIDFDKEVKKLLEEHQGIYRRYSDDIIIVCPLEDGKKLKQTIIETIADKEKVNLKIEKNKTNLYHFTVEEGKAVCRHEDKKTRKKLEYLGFAFDGTNILLKNASVGKFYCKMHKSVSRSLFFACHMHNSTQGTIFERRLISRFTYAGSKPHRIYKRSLHSKKFEKVANLKTYGNYLTYVKRAAETMGEDKIKRQLRHCCNKLSKAIKEGKMNIHKSYETVSLFPEKV